MNQVSRLVLSLPFSAIVLAQSAMAADPQFIDWTLVNTATDVAQGAIGSIDVTLSGAAMGDEVVDGTSNIFSSEEYTPPIASGDRVGLAAATSPNLYTISFSQSVLDPVFHIADLSTRITFNGAVLTRLSGNSFFAVAGDSVSGGGFAGAGRGTVRLNGVFTSISFSAVDLIQPPPGGDGFYIQVGVSPVPEPAGVALLLTGLLAVASRVQARRGLHAD